jgi:hypothetical protein
MDKNKYKETLRAMGLEIVRERKELAKALNAEIYRECMRSGEFDVVSLCYRDNLLARVQGRLDHTPLQAKFAALWTELYGEWLNEEENILAK